MIGTECSSEHGGRFLRDNPSLLRETKDSLLVLYHSIGSFKYAKGIQVNRTSRILKETSRSSAKG